MSERKKKQSRKNTKWMMTLLFLVCALLVLSSCAKDTLTGNWELVPREGALNDTAMTGMSLTKMVP